MIQASLFDTAKVLQFESFFNRFPMHELNADWALELGEQFVTN